MHTLHSKALFALLLLIGTVTTGSAQNATSPIQSCTK